ncbi:MAG: hypothetical protein LBT58_03150 [Endomicrobium sp.]|jgi:hypothetical protein|nr:hypothetical protein [Endomicrobium sp.]
MEETTVNPAKIRFRVESCANLRKPCEALSRRNLIFFLAALTVNQNLFTFEGRIGSGDNDNALFNRY